MNEDQSYCTFLARGIHCGVPVERVREIISDQRVTHVPLAHPSVRGLINLRGQILTVVDVARTLGINPANEECDLHAIPRFHMIADAGRELISMCVDEMGPVITPQLDELEPIPPNVEPEAAEAIVAAARLPEHLVLLLDLDRVHRARGLHRLAGASAPKPTEALPKPKHDTTTDRTESHS